MKIIPMVMAVLTPLAGLASTARAENPGPCSDQRDVGADGTADWRTYYDYRNGRLQTKTTYAAGASSPSRITELVYDAQGRVWGRAVDTDADGDSDRNVYLAYSGTSERPSAEAVDEGPNFMMDRVRHFTYDGNVRRTELDEYADGTIDSTEKTIFNYDGQGRLLEEWLDRGDDGSIDRVTSHEYDADGNRTSTLIDEGDDGDVDEVIEFDYGCW